MAARFTGLSMMPHNDLERDATGSPVLVFDGRAIGQHARQRLLEWKSEWFLDREVGVDYLTYVLGRQPNERSIAESVVKREVVNTPGVVEILEFDSDFDRASRGLKITKMALRTVLDDEIEVDF